MQRERSAEGERGADSRERRQVAGAGKCTWEAGGYTGVRAETGKRTRWSSDQTAGGLLSLYRRVCLHRHNNRRDRGRLAPQLLGWGTNNVLVPPNFLAVVFKKQEIPQQLVIRMQDLASEFSKIFRGWYPGPSLREEATPFHTRCWDPNLGPPQLLSRGCAPEPVDWLIESCFVAIQLGCQQDRLWSSSCYGEMECVFAGVDRQPWTVLGVGALRLDAALVWWRLWLLLRGDVLRRRHIQTVAYNALRVQVRSV